MLPVKPVRGKRLLWLWLLPAAVSWGLISCLKPAGWLTMGEEMLVIGTLCGVAGFVLACQSFTSARQRLLGGCLFTGSSLGLVFSFAFLGCLPMGPRPMSPAQAAAQQTRKASQNKARVAGHLVPRDAAADDTMLDLSPYYDSLPGFSSRANRVTGKPGTHSWNGIKFDVRARVQLQWGGRQRVEGIPVGRKCTDLYFLHGTEWGMTSNVVSQFVIHLTGGKVVTLPILFGRDVAGEYERPRGSSVSAPTNAVVWQERLITNAPPQPLRRFFISHWRNPLPALPVETIDFVLGPAGGNAFLVAITVQPAN